MAGLGSRFSEAGYKDPKPFIKVIDKPMIELVIKNLTPSLKHRFIFIMQKTCWNEYPAEDLFNAVCNSDYEVVLIDGLTDGAAQTVLCASDFIDNNNPLMIANSDQFVQTSIDEYISGGSDFDGFVMTMNATDPKWSYARLENDYIVEIVEKEVVSNIATVGIYNFKTGSSFVESAKEMIFEQDKSKGEYYVAPVYTRLANKGLKIKSICIGSDKDAMCGLGIPDDLNNFISTQGVKEIIAKYTNDIQNL